MTIEQLLEVDAATLESFSDAQLMDFFKPYLVWVKPDKEAIERERQTNKNNPSKTHRSNVPSFNTNLAKAQAIAKQMGIDFDKL